MGEVGKVGEVGEVGKDWTQVAGLALTVPRLVYAVELSSGGRLELRRGGWGAWQAERWKLVLHAPGASDGVFEAGFDLRSFAESASGERWAKGAESLASQLRTLLVDSRLLSQPDAVVKGKLPSQVDRGLAPELEQALAELTRRLREAVTPSPYGEPQCDACTAATRKRVQEQEALWERTKGRQGQSRWGSMGEPGDRCPHARAAYAGLASIYRAFPVLVFELCGLLCPELRFGPPTETGSAEALPPRRYVLESRLFGGMTRRWLLDANSRAPEGYGHRLSYGYRGASVRVSIPRAVEGAGGLPAKLREALMFCAAGYGMTQPAEALVMGEADAAAAAPTCPQSAVEVSSVIALPEESPSESSGGAPERGRPVAARKAVLS